MAPNTRSIRLKTYLISLTLLGFRLQSFTIAQVVGSCPSSGSTNLFINAGGLFTANGYRCDVASLWRPGTAKYATTRPVNTTATGCTDQYQSHAYTSSGDLVYTIPVPAGSYKVDLMFMENYKPHTVGSRKFSVTVNSASLSPTGTTGTEFDIVALTGGTDIPYVVSANTTATSAGITVTIGRLPGGNNPFLSGIVISGTNATGSIGTSGAGNCAEDNGTTKPVEPTGDPDSGKCPGPKDFFINAGGRNIPGGIRCDIANEWASPNKKNYAITRAVDTNVKGGCFEQYKTSAWAQTGDLVYTIPVSPGDYTVSLGFLEVVPFAFKGFRLFTITINDQAVLVEGNANVDIFGLSGGVDKPYLVMHNTTAVGANANIKVTLGRTNKNNPFLSFLNIVGTGATSKVGTTGLQSCKALIDTPIDTPIPTPTDTPVCPTGNLPPPVSDFSKPHDAHANAGGPYVATDFARTGKVKIELNGLQSHSHGSLNSNFVEITDWIWSWTDFKNPAADKTTGKVVLTGAIQTSEFPVGTFPITLEVRDQNCDRAVETTTVTVNPARKDGAFCYFYDYIDSESEMVPIESNITLGKLPSYATKVGDINFANAASFSSVPFKENSFAARCVFSIESTKVETLNYKIMHSGPIKVFTDGVQVASSTSYEPGTTTNIPAKTFSVGIHEWQVLYFRPKTLTGQLKFLLANDALVPMSDYGYDASTVLPVITGSSKTTSPKGGIIKIFGSGFFNGVVVKFGMVTGETTDVTAKEISVEVPAQEAGISSVRVTVTTNAGISNDFTFQYPGPAPCQSVNWVTTTFKAKTGTGDYVIKNLIVLKYGPDGRLYAGTNQDSVLVIAHDKNLKVTFDCQKKLNSGNLRYVTGLNFNPVSLALKLYISTATINWKKSGYIKDFVEGWTNGKVQSVSARPNGCFNNDVSDVVTGLPVSNADHTPSWIEFLPDGRMIISIGGATNGGIIEGDGLGGIPASPYTGAIISCPPDKLTAIKYTNATTPDKAKVIGTGGCSVYATGFRNSFGGYFATNGEVYCNDNSPNRNFGFLSTDCNGGKTPGVNLADLFFKVEEGKCHGHPNIPRALADKDPAQCVFRSKSCTQPLWNGVPRSTNGMVEYRSNLFSGALKGNIFLTKYSSGSKGKGLIQRLILDENTGGIKKNGIVKNYHVDSGLHVVEGPRGELIMNRYQKNTIYVRTPFCSPAVSQMYLIGVHPKRGPAAGGHKVLVSGFNFGTNPMATFGSSNCTNVQVLDDTQFTCSTPAGTPNTQVKVEILGPGGETNTITKGTDYWYW